MPARLAGRAVNRAAPTRSTLGAGTTGAPALRAAAVPSPCSAAPIAPSRTVTNRLRLPSHHRGLTGQGRVPLWVSGFGLLSFDSRRLRRRTERAGACLDGMITGPSCLALASGKTG